MPGGSEGPRIWRSVTAKAFCMPEEGWSYQTFMNVHSFWKAAGTSLPFLCTCSSYSSWAQTQTATRKCALYFRPGRQQSHHYWKQKPFCRLWRFSDGKLMQVVKYTGFSEPLARNHSQVSIWAGSSLSSSQVDRSAAFLLSLQAQQRGQVRQHSLHTLAGEGHDPSGVSCASASSLDLQREQCFSQPGLENKRTHSCCGAGLWCLMTQTFNSNPG